LGLLGLVVDIARGQVDGLAGLVEAGTAGAAAHQPGLGPPAARVGGAMLGRFGRLVHRSSPSQKNTPTGTGQGFAGAGPFSWLFNVAASRSANHHVTVWGDTGSARRCQESRRHSSGAAPS